MVRRRTETRTEDWLGETLSEIFARSLTICVLSSSSFRSYLNEVQSVASRRSERGQFGGQRQSEISTPTKYPPDFPHRRKFYLGGNKYPFCVQ